MKNVCKVKTIQRIAGIIALAAIIGFSMAACNNGSDVNQTPVADDYIFGNLNQTAGSVTAVTITPKSGKSSGAISIKYDGSATIPQTAGTYAVTFDVAAAAGWNAENGLSAGTLVITDNLVVTDDSASSGIDTTALDAVINEAWIVRNGAITASTASEVPAGRWWVTLSEWNAFNSVLITAAETKANPSSQSAVDTAKTNLQTAIVTFNAAKKDGSGASFTLSGTITVKNNGQIIPYVQIIARTGNWDRQEDVLIPSMEANSPWSIITKPFSSPTDIVFRIVGWGSDKWDNMLFDIDYDGFTLEVYNTNINNIFINLENLRLITISGTFNFNYNGKIIPSVEINIKREDNDLRLGTVNLYNAGNNTPWSIAIPAQNVDTDVIFQIVGFDGPTLWSDELLFALWSIDFGVKVGNQNKSGIALNLITVSGTINVTYNGSPPLFAVIQISKNVWIASTDLYNPSANAPWSIIIPAFTSNTEVHIDVGVGNNEDALIWTGGTTKTVKDSSVSGIVLYLGNITD